MVKRWTVSAVVLALLTGGAWAEGVAVGDPAPKLAVGEFVKGEPVTELKAGTVYVVEFWATWCGPCKASIPHLSELAKQYKNVKFIGANVWERDQKLIKPFVDEMGDKMGYAVAYDKFEGDDKTGQMAKTWMQAAGQNGIPAAFIINDEGKIAWIGHPMTMDNVLPKVIDKTWDIAKAAAEFKAEQAREGKQREIMAALRKPDVPVADKIKMLREWFAQDPGAEGNYGRLLITELAKLEKPDDLIAYLTGRIEALKENADGLWRLADSVMNIKGVAAEALKLVLGAAQKADELLKSGHDIASGILCRAYLLTGDKAKAIEAGDRAVKLAEGKGYVGIFKGWLEEARKLPDAK